jgi:hypothetical protein
MQYGSTSIVRNDEVAAIRHNQTDVELGLGQIRDTTVRVYVRSNYAARYNYAAKNYDCVEESNAEPLRRMRGDRFLLNNVLIFFILCFLVGSVLGYMSVNEAIGAIPIVVSIIYLLLTCYNWHVYRINPSVMHDCMIEVEDYCLGNMQNRFFKVPINARIQNRELLAASDGRTTAVLARLQQRYCNLTELTIMLYEHKYKTTYGTFPLAIIIHFILFLGTLALPIYVFITGKNIET